MKLYKNFMKIVWKILLIVVIVLFVENAAFCGSCTSKPAASRQQTLDLIYTIQESIKNKDYCIVYLSAVLRSGVISFQGSPQDLFHQIRSRIPKNKTTFILFSEMFFSNRPLNTTQVNQIIEECKKLTQENQRLFVCVNFLHKFSLENRPSWLPAEGINSNNKLAEYINTQANPLTQHELESIFLANRNKIFQNF